MPLSKSKIIIAVQQFYDLNGVSPRIKDVHRLPFSKKLVITLFGKWSTMLQMANLPLNRYPRQNLTCANCGKRFTKQVKEMRKSLRHFCRSACSAQFYTTGRKHTEETKAKISESLKAHRIFI